MSDREFDRIARRWLEDGPTSMPTDALQAALDAVHVTRQRRAWWPAGRARTMGSTIRYLVGATAVVIAVVIGIYLLPLGAGIGGRAPTPTPLPTASPIPLPAGEGPMPLAQAGGTYLTGEPFPIAITVTAPAGWAGNIGGPYAAYLYGPAASGNQSPDVAFTLSQKLSADPCPGTTFHDLVPQPGPTVDDFAASLAGLPWVNATTPTDVTIDGLPGKQLTLTASSRSGGCTSPSEGYALWQLPLGAVFSLAPGQSMVVRILDVAGSRLVISSDTFAQTTAQDTAALEQVLGSIHFVNPR